MFRQVLDDGESSGNFVECRVDAGGERAHAGGAGKSDQGDEQCVLDEILTFFTLEVHDRDRELVDEVLHAFFPLELISLSTTGLAL